MTRRTLLLIAPPVFHAGSWWTSRVASKPHLDSLAGFVRDIADVVIIELDANVGAGATDLEALDPLAAIADYLSDDVALVGISCWTSMHYLGAAAVAERVRACAPHVPIVVGGHHPSAMPADFTAHGLADWVVRGDGEHALRALCEAWPARPETPQIIEGARYTPHPGHIDWPGYAKRGEDTDVVWVAMSRGCPFKCTFCVEPQLGSRWNAYSVDDALSIVDGLVRTHAPRVICFSDPLFGANRRWTRAFLDGLLARQLPTMFWAETRADLMTPELLELAIKCHFKLDFGLDTGSLAMARQMVKSPNPTRYLARSRETLRRASALGLPHEIYLLFNYPGETPETARETQAWVEAIVDDGEPASGWVSSQTFFILPGTQVYTDMQALAEQHGTEIRNPTWWRQAGDHHTLATDVLPSAAWRGREAELQAHTHWRDALNGRWTQRCPTDVHMFRYRFFGGS